MMDCMTTPMASNLKPLSNASSDAVDATMYCQMIGSLMYLMNTRPDICFAVNTLSQFLIDPRHVHLIQLIMGSSIRLIIILTWKVMLIYIGKAIPSIAREL